MGFACWIIKTTDTDSEYVMFVAFPWQQCLQERAFSVSFTRASLILLISILTPDFQTFY
jgi:hypothetical protein